MELVKTFSKYDLLDKAKKITCKFSTTDNTMELNFVLEDNFVSKNTDLTDFSFAISKYSNSKDSIKQSFEHTLATLMGFLFENLSTPTNTVEDTTNNLKDVKVEKIDVAIQEPVVSKEDISITSIKEAPATNGINSNAFMMPPPPMNFNSGGTQSGPVPARPTEPPKMPTLTVPPGNSDEVIKDVQKLAIQLQLNTSGLTYKEFAAKAFEFAKNSKEEIPSMDELTYQEAIQLIHYGNERSKSR